MLPINIKLVDICIQNLIVYTESLIEGGNKQNTVRKYA